MPPLVIRLRLNTPVEEVPRGGVFVGGLGLRAGGERPEGFADKPGKPPRVGEHGGDLRLKAAHRSVRHALKGLRSALARLDRDGLVRRRCADHLADKPGLDRRGQTGEIVGVRRAQVDGGLLPVDDEGKRDQVGRGGTAEPGYLS